MRACRRRTKARTAPPAASNDGTGNIRPPFRRAEQPPSGLNSGARYDRHRKGCGHKFPTPGPGSASVVHLPLDTGAGVVLLRADARLAVRGQFQFHDDGGAVRLQALFQKLGYMESSSSDLFDQFLKTGMGAKPLIAGYESQLLEFAVQEPETWEQIQGDIVLVYPTPTVWSSHVFIALDEAGAQGIDALLDEEVQRLAWENHGFRTGVYDAPTETAQFGVEGVAEEVTQVAPMPSAPVMEAIIAALS